MTSEKGSAPVPTQPIDLERAQKAVEFGGYLATAAERYISAVDAYDEHDGEDQCAGRTDAFRGLQSAIHEFRKRVARIAEPRS